MELLGNLERSLEPLKCGTFGEPEPEPVCATSWNLKPFKCGTFVARFPAAAPNHPEALLARPQALQAVRGKNKAISEWPTSRSFHKQLGVAHDYCKTSLP